MSVTSHMSVSLDGFVAGPDQTRDTPLGVRGFDLHRWHIDRCDDEVDQRWRDELLSPRGAYVMGRNMFGPVRGEWATEPDWQGWWGDEPPYHAPVFVLTHHEHEPIELNGGTTFHFVTDGMASALRQARAVAGDRDVDIAGGASTVRQAFAEHAIDVLRLDIAPVWLGRGESLFAEVGGVTLTPVAAEHSPLVTHVRYDVTYA